MTSQHKDYSFLTRISLVSNKNLRRTIFHLQLLCKSLGALIPKILWLGAILESRDYFSSKAVGEPPLPRAHLIDKHHRAAVTARCGKQMGKNSNSSMKAERTYRLWRGVLPND